MACHRWRNRRPGLPQPWALAPRTAANLSVLGVQPVRGTVSCRPGPELALSPLPCCCPLDETQPCKPHVEMTLRLGSFHFYSKGKESRRPRPGPLDRGPRSPCWRTTCRPRGRSHRSPVLTRVSAAGRGRGRAGLLRAQRRPRSFPTWAQKSRVKFEESFLGTKHSLNHWAQRASQTPSPSSGPSPVPVQPVAPPSSSSAPLPTGQTWQGWSRLADASISGMPSPGRLCLVPWPACCSLWEGSRRVEVASLAPAAP